MISSDAVRGYHDLMILSLLASGDSYGYALAQAIEQRSGGLYTIRESTLYAVCARLEAQGCIAAYQGRETHGRPRVYYTLTKYGRDLLRTRRAEWQALKTVVDAFASPPPKRKKKTASDL